MYFHKYEHPMNFYSPREGELEYNWKSLGDNVYHYWVEGARWEGNPSQAEFDTLDFGNKESFCRSDLSTAGGFSLIPEENGSLETLPEMPFGVCGSKWILRFRLNSCDRFYGMGEKNNGFEKSRIRSKFWNTDVWADFSGDQIENGITDPMYISLPYLLLKRGKFWYGIQVNNPYPVFMNTGAGQVIEGVQETNEGGGEFYIGSTDGEPDLFIIAGMSAEDVTQRLYRLCGTSPLPPLWSLGYQQSRWGYACDSDLLEIDEKMEEHEIPCDGIWMDIDYLIGYRVFTIDREKFPALDQTVKTIASHGRRVVPILDPGVKADPEYSACREGLEQGLFCLNEENRPYIGFVWPGASYFPDFSLPEVRSWWASKTQEMADLGFPAFWIDMNDPSAGSAELEGMRFQKGTLPHEAFHNQYSVAMHKATWDGLKQSMPEERPFVLSRSGFIGTNRWGAVWMGDNISNWHHLRKTIEMALNLSLSGMAFFGADIGGFGGDASDANFIAWHKACFLFPFFRNHCADGQKKQEPWNMGPLALELSRTFIRARYALLPYIYNLFITQEQTGAPLIRPLLYNYEGFDLIDDQFLVGESILQAPVLQDLSEEPLNIRTLVLPEGYWLDINRSQWIPGPCQLDCPVEEEQTPLFIRAGSILPVKRAGRAEGELNEVDLLIFPEPDNCTSSYTYRYDRGNGYEYKNKGFGEFRVQISSHAGKMQVTIDSIKTGYAPCTVRFGLYSSIKEIMIQTGGEEEVLKLEDEKIPFCGSIMEFQFSREIVIN
ncbi:glycoside hydrolase family 31 protein [Oceanispirochaeta sp. M1]|uniref:glycoside hydrolase family 31 protein n=2 Tax=Oceanispirochaeta TaxID=2035349 RepID=UPI000E0999B8|nr:glycoside hydrolase family 31 protein [Oceanispirochaeta sp. M1]RDG30110.1 hypothetical protein DV872_18385 [Oceanispirochaeta sp. M1]